eukprot:Sspe_Gene.56573::Locus_31115_Transcript_1_1_Confidence_1.000_Length_3075::g.56573::m.56573/K12820/DHX15, PRP43; pre-mRNA-splicing factor ATP-dependent RNA helicase DHX15/PRP43
MERMSVLWAWGAATLKDHRLFARAVRRFNNRVPILASHSEFTSHLTTTPYGTVIMSLTPRSGSAAHAVQMAYDVVSGGILCALPWKAAADALRDTVHEELGYAAFRNSAMRFVMDSDLLGILAADPLLGRWRVVVVQAHCPSAHTEVALPLLREALRKRAQDKASPLHLVLVTAASPDVGPLIEYFGMEGCTTNVVKVQGAMSPADIAYSGGYCTEGNCVARAVRKVKELAAHLTSIGMRSGILVFLPRRTDILQALRQLGGVPGVHAVPLHEGLRGAELRQVVKSTEGVGRRVVLATHLAESIAVEGVSVVVDTGLVMQNTLDATKRAVAQVVPISQSRAEVRRECAGGTFPRTCCRLYSETWFNGLERDAVPEVSRADLANGVLVVKATGHDIETLPFVTTPAREVTVSAMQRLARLGAIAGKPRHLTSLGRAVLGLGALDVEQRVFLVRCARSGAAATAARVCGAMVGINAGMFTAHWRGLPQEVQCDAVEGKLGDVGVAMAVMRHVAELKEGCVQWCKNAGVAFRNMQEGFVAMARIKAGADTISDTSPIVLRELVFAYHDAHWSGR